MLFFRLLTENKVVLETLDYEVGDVIKTNSVEKEFFEKELVRVVTVNLGVVDGSERVVIKLDYHNIILWASMVKELLNTPPTTWLSLISQHQTLQEAFPEWALSVLLNNTGTEISLTEVALCEENGVHLYFSLFLKGLPDPITMSFSVEGLEELDKFLMYTWEEVRDLTKSLNDYQGLTESEIKELHSKAQDLMYVPKRNDELDKLLEEGLIDSSFTGVGNSQEEMKTDLFGGLLNQDGEITEELDFLNNFNTLGEEDA